MYQERMNGYYPEVIRAIQEIQAIIDSEYPEFEELNEAKDNIVKNAYLTTMDESRILEWEKIFNITPLPQSTLEDRREAIIARIRGQGKLNSAMIESIVSSFTGGITESWIIDSTLYVKIYPPSYNKTYLFDNVKDALSVKLPAHLDLEVYRNYATWGAIKGYASTWGDVVDNFATWHDVIFFISSGGEDIFEYLVDESGNSITNELNNKLFN